MNTFFNNFGKTSEFKYIVKLNDGKYLVSFDKVDILVDEVVYKNSKPVKTGNSLPSGESVWKSIILDFHADPATIVSTLTQLIDKDTQYNIINSFIWNGYNVYLSKENQMNYKNAFDLAVSTNGESLPVTFKFKKDGKGVYYTFDTVAELRDFYIKLNKHINGCLENGWKRKDDIIADNYKI